MLVTLGSWSSLAILLLAALGIGRWTYRALRVDTEGELAALVWSTALGFVICGWLLSMAAFAGGLTPLLISLLTAVGLVAGCAELACAYLVLRNPLRARVATSDDLVAASSLPIPDKRLKNGTGIGMTAVLAVTFVCALAPPISTTAISESLDQPKMILLEGSLHGGDGGVVPRPQFGSMLFAWALLLDGPITASLVSWAFGVLLAGATALFASMFVGRAWARLAAALAFSAPGVLYQMHAPLGDLMAATFATLALTAWWKCAVEHEPPRWLILAGLFLGAALATKAALVALPMAVAGAFLVRSVCLRVASRELSLCAMRTLLCAFPIAAPWWLWTFAKGGTLVPPELRTNPLIEFGPLLLATVPFLAVARKLRGLNMVLGILIGCLAIGWLIAPQARSFAVMTPLLATLATWSIIELPRLPVPFRRWVTVSLACCGVVSAMGLVRPLAEAVPVACGGVSRDTYLRGKLPAYAAAEVANCVMHEHECLQSSDLCRAYFKCRVRPQRGSDKATPLGNEYNLVSPEVTHVLVRRESSATQNAAPVVSEPGYGRAELLSHFHDDARGQTSYALPLTDYVATTIDGNQIHYRLLRLQRGTERNPTTRPRSLRSKSAWR